MGAIVAKLLERAVGAELASVLGEVSENLLKLYEDGAAKGKIDREALMSRRSELRLIREAKLRALKTKRRS